MNMDEIKDQKKPATETGRKKASKKRAGDKICENMTYAAREAFKRLRTNVLMAFPEEEAGKCQVIGVTSAQPSEGKSTVSVNLAYSLAELGKSVLLIDGDMRRPSLHDKLGFRPTPGLSELLTKEDNVGKAVVRYKSTVGDIHFDVITGGSIPGNPSELLNSKRFEALMKALTSACDYVVMDLPPINAVIDAVNASRLTDGMIVVLREKNCPRDVLADCMDQLAYARANVLGFVVNGSTEGAGKRYQYGQQAYRYGK